MQFHRTVIAAHGIAQNPDGYTPKTGDLLLLDTDLDGSADHAGIVTSADDSTLTAIVGDADKAVRKQHL